jgi:hypothetical protein
MKKYWALATLLIIAQCTVSAIEIAGPIAPEGGFFAQPLFDPASVTEFLPTLQELGQLDLAPNKGARHWANMIQAANSPEGIAVLAPIFKEMTPESTQSLKQNIAALSSSQDPETRKILIKTISTLFNSAKNTAAPKVFAALSDYATRLNSEDKSQSISPEEFARVKALNQALLPLAKFYAKSESQKNIIGDISHSLAGVQRRHIMETLEPFWTSGTTPEPDSYAGNLIRNPILNSRLPWKSNPQLKTKPTEVRAHDGIAGILATNQFPHLFVPTHEDMINIGGQSVRRTLFPNVPNGTGDDIPAILAIGNRASLSTKIMLYEETLDQDVQSILEGLKQGKPYDIIADYSNLFPEKARQKHRTRSPQLQQLVGEYLAGNPNLKLSVLKGIGSIGIQHSKYRIWNIPQANGQTSSILETGSYNYSTHSQQHNWENVVLIDDKKLIGLYNQYFDWAKSLARPFSEDLDPMNPSIKKNSIPQDLGLGQSFNGVPLPIASFSPNGGTGEAWTKIINNSKQSVLIGMFAFFPWVNLVSTMLSRIDSGLSLRILTDVQQSQNPFSIAAMERVKNAGAKVRIISGASGDGLFHNKLLFGDPQANGIVATGSTNMSFNGTIHNFENTLYLKGGYLGALIDYMEALWNMGTEPDFSQHSTPQPQNQGNNPPPARP